MEKLKYLVGYLPFKVNVGDGRAPFELTVYNFSNVYRYLTEIYLRPLSDLTKEIKVNGEKFVPIEWFEIGDDTNESIEFDHGNIKLIKRLEQMAKFNVHSEIDYLPNFVVQKLLEWHFDIYGLIEKCLAIDINTLNK